MQPERRVKQQRSPRVIVAAVIITGGRVLACERSAPPEVAGRWEFPGGKVEPGEMPEAALVRELREELDLVVEEDWLEPLLFASHRYTDLHLLMPLYLCRRWSGAIRANENQVWRWTEPSAMKALPMPPADGPLVEKLCSWLAHQGS
jgi:8-oxo-dGTP diphosphatase